MAFQNKWKFKETELGMIPEDWRITTLEDISVKVTDGSHFSPKEISNGTKLIATVKNMTYNAFDFQNCKRISEDDFGNLARNGCAPEKGDILISKDGANCLDLIFVYNEEEKIVLLSSIAIVRLKRPFNPIFYRYFLLSPNAQKIMRDGYVTGSAIPRVVLKDFRKIPVPVPPKDIPNTIANTLFSLDSKIELNQQMNKTLEKIGQAIFKHWFIDFEFPIEKGRPYKSGGGEMVDSELGGIPKGWRISTLREFVNIERGLSYKGSGLCETGIPLINLGTMAPNHGFIYDGLKHYVGGYKERNTVQKGDIVIANTDITQKRDVLGSPAIVPDLNSEKILFTHHIYAVRNRSQLPNKYIYYLLQVKRYEDRTRGFATGTTVLFLPEDAILDFPFALPDKNTLSKFVSILEPIHSRTELNHNEAIMIACIRDSLLPKLMSGKIRVSI